MPGALDADFDTFWEKFRREAPVPFKAGVYAGAFVYTVTPVITVGVPLPSFALPRRLRDKHADRVVQHDLYLVRQAVFLLKIAGGFAWGADPRVREKLDLPPYAGDPGGWRTK
ncbi:MAG: hypothetical protein H6736_18615 [Alphaproteobacteria bacterium]|nr:hypothetical protein [Alphaproteobacteria bacterium]MCB9693830.1 hypothetical protein [Alphaproteobacteria bacterium]